MIYETIDLFCKRHERFLSLDMLSRIASEGSTLEMVLLVAGETVDIMRQALFMNVSCSKHRGQIIGSSKRVYRFICDLQFTG